MLVMGSGGHVGVGDSPTYQLGSVVGNTPLLGLGSLGFNPWSGHSFLFLQLKPPMPAIVLIDNPTPLSGPLAECQTPLA